MYSHKETITIDDPQRLVLKQPLPLRKGRRVDVLVVAEGEDAELEVLLRIPLIVTGDSV